SRMICAFPIAYAPRDERGSNERVEKVRDDLDSLYLGWLLQRICAHGAVELVCRAIAARVGGKLLADVWGEHADRNAHFAYLDVELWNGKRGAVGLCRLTHELSGRCFRVLLPLFQQVRWKLAHIVVHELRAVLA